MTLVTMLSGTSTMIAGRDVLQYSTRVEWFLADIIFDRTTAVCMLLLPSLPLITSPLHDFERVQPWSGRAPRWFVSLWQV